MATESTQDLAAPLAERWFEDYTPGAVCDYGPVAFTADEIVEYARRYDPQAIHTDAASAAAGPFGGLIASGWHTVGLVMRVLVEHYLSSVAALVSPGVDELRWHAPVRPGDVLRVRVTVVDARRSQSKPDRGLIRSRVEAFNQRGEMVQSFVAMNLLRCRDAAPQRQTSIRGGDGFSDPAAG
jgi:acyl dehydratase